MVFQSALWTSEDLLKALRLLHYGASMTVTVLTFAKVVMMQKGGASNEAIQQIVDSAKFDLRQEMGEMQLKQDHIDERAAQEYAQTSAKAQEWIQKIESALQGAGRFGNLVLMHRKRRRCVGNGSDDADYADLR